MTEVKLRPATPADEQFLRAVYRSTREPELDITPWTEEQKAAFVGMQFDAQAVHYANAYPDATIDVIVVDGEDAGRLYTARLDGEIRVADISLLPAYRGRGAATELLSGVIDEAKDSGLRVVIHVEKNNPARRLYERLGFTVTEDLGIYLRLDWVP